MTEAEWIDCPDCPSPFEQEYCKTCDDTGKIIKYLDSMTLKRPTTEPTFDDLCGGKDNRTIPKTERVRRGCWICRSAYLSLGRDDDPGAFCRLHDGRKINDETMLCSGEDFEIRESLRP